MSLQRIDHIVFNVRSVEQSEKFYREIVGLEVRRQIPGGIGTFLTCGTTDHDMAIFQVKAEPIEGDVPGPLTSRKPGMNHVAFVANNLEDVQAIYRRLRASGVEQIKLVDHGTTRSIYFTDPDGNTIEVGYDVPPEDRIGEHLMEMRSWDVETGKAAPA